MQMRLPNAHSAVKGSCLTIHTCLSVHKCDLMLCYMHTALTASAVCSVFQASLRQQQLAGWCREQEHRRAYPAVHDKLNALPLELLCGIDGDLAIIGAQDMVMGVHQPHSHNILQQSTYAMPSKIRIAPARARLHTDRTVKVARTFAHCLTAL